MNSFLKSLALFVAITAIIMVALSKTTIYITSVTWSLLGYFTLFTAAFHYGLMSASKGKPQQFIRYYMGATTFKLLVHLIVLIVYCLFNRDHAVHFIVTFTIFYFLFTIFEFTAMKRSFKQEQVNQKQA